MDKDCPHLIPDENWKCEDCGADYPQPDLPPDWNPDIGDVKGICTHLKQTCKEFSLIIKANTDADGKPKMRVVGGQLFRLPHDMIIRAMIGPSFLKARTLGYRGTESKWREMVIEEISNPSKNCQAAK